MAYVPPAGPSQKILRTPGETVEVFKDMHFMTSAQSKNGLIIRATAARVVTIPSDTAWVGQPS